MNRSCGGCTACCRILPVVELDKPALTRCAHQRTGKGCAIYDRRPPSCRLWSCLWLVDEATADLSRPDRSHYVIDPVPDYVTARDDEKGTSEDWPVMQIWVDERYPDAHRDPALRAMLDKFGVMSIVRTGSDKAFLLVPPSKHPRGVWEERTSNVNMERERDPKRTAAAWDALGSKP